MNSMEWNKIAAASIGALLVFLLLNFLSGLIYGTREVHHAEGDHGPVLAYAVAVEDASGGGGEAEQVDLLALFQAADPAAGEKSFRACGACHAVEPGVNKLGPTLYDVVGRDIAAVDGFAYSDAMASMDGAWTSEPLFHFLENPKAYVPGTKMSFAGISNPQQIVDLVAYLNQIGDSPVDLTEGLQPLAPAADGSAEAGAAQGEAVAQGAGTTTASGAGVAGEGSVVDGGTAVDAIDPAAPGAAQGDGVAEAAGGSAPAITTRSATETTSSSLAGGAPSTTVGVEVVDTDDVELESTTPVQIGEESDLPGFVETETQVVPNVGDPGAGQPLQGETAVQQGGAVQEVPAGQPLPVQQVPAQPGAVQVPAGQPVPAQPPAGQAPAGSGPVQVPAEQAAPAQPGTGQQGAVQPPAGEVVAVVPVQPVPAQPAAAPAPAAGAMAGDAAAGERLFRRCAACHSVEPGVNRVGPSLHDIVGRDIATVEGFNYSDALAAHEGTWTPEALSQYLENPKAAIPGNKMAFAGLRNEQDRIDVITYLQQVAQ